MRKWLAASSVVLLTAAARGQVRVMDSEDVVKLVSGEEIRGKVLGSGLKAVVIVVKGEEGALAERTVPREQVESVTRGGASPTMTSYATETVEGLRVVTGESEGGVAEGEGGGLGEPAGGAKPKAGAARPPRAKGGGKPPAGGGQATPKISKQQLEKLMQTNPGIERMVRAAGGPDKAMSLLQQQGGDPQIAKFLQQFLKNGELPAAPPKR